LPCIRQILRMAPKPKAFAKKAPKAKAKARSKSLARAPTKERLFSDAVEAGKERLENILSELFKCYDTDEDGQLERVEFLDGEEKRLGRLEFGPRQRKASFQWFKEAGAEGIPMTGMFLSQKNWKAAYVTSAIEESGIRDDTAKLAEWIWDEKAKFLVAACYRKPAVYIDTPLADPDTPPTSTEYPIQCGLRELSDKLQEACCLGRQALVLSSGLREVETFLSYQLMNVVDAKKILNEVFIEKSKSKEEALDDLRNTLTKAMNSSGFAKPLHIHMGNTAFDWVSFCNDDFPADLFSGTLWTIDNAFQRKFFDDGHKMSLELEDEQRWKQFHVIVSSTFDLDQANVHLFDKIPHYDELAIIVIDPASVQ